MTLEEVRGEKRGGGGGGGGGGLKGRGGGEGGGTMVTIELREGEARLKTNAEHRSWNSKKQQQSNATQDKEKTFVPVE